MKIIPLKKSATVYSCNSYLILGDWNRIKDLNTIIDPGSNDFVLEEIERLPTGCGKMAVEQVILTHHHFDHAAGLRFLKDRYQCRVLAFSAGPGVDELVADGQLIKAGDGFLEVIHTPGHSSDSICLYAPKEKAIFPGDTQLRVMPPGGSFPLEYIAAQRSLGTREIQKFYSGHDGAMPK